MNTYNSKELPVNCSDPVVPVFSHSFDSLVPPKYPEIRYVIPNDASYSQPQPALQTSVPVVIPAAPVTAAEPSICNHGGVQYWSAPSIW